MQFQMLNDWILLQEHREEEQQMSNGLFVGAEGLPQVGRATILFMPESIKREFRGDKSYLFGLINIKGKGVDLSAGDQVIFSKYQCEEIKVKDEDGKWLERTKVGYKFAIQAKII